MDKQKVILSDGKEVVLFVKEKLTDEELQAITDFTFDEFKLFIKYFLDWQEHKLQ